MFIFNPWRPYPLWIPKKDGWYQCTIQSFEEPEERWVMDLYFNTRTKIWEDKRRQNVFTGYKVFKSGRGTQDYNRVYTDKLCIRNDVIAWKKVDKPCKRFGKNEKGA